MRALRNFVGGEFVDHDGPTAEIVNPATGQAYATAPVSGAADVDRAYAAADAAFASWSRTTPAERQLALLRMADRLAERADEFTDAECENTGKPWQLTRDEELPPCSDQLRFFAGAARTLEGRAAGEYLANHTSYIRREPVGVVGQVTPWNYPLMMAMWKIAPALAAGNTIVLKPSDTTPVSTIMLAELAAEFLPAGVLNVITGDRETGAALVAHPRPDMVSITGSVRAGMAVAKAAADGVKRVHLELGGKAPVVIFDDADVEAAADAVVTAGYFNAGQDCTAATRVLAQAGIYDDFVAALTDRAKNTITAGPDNPAASYGPLNNPNQLARVAGMVSRAPQHATVTTGGAALDSPGFFYPPTVVAGLHQDDEMIQDEIFGPVVTVQRFADEAEAIGHANGVKYGLSASVFTRDHGTALRLTAALNFGCVWVNTHIPFISEMPHGGFGFSGYGKDLSVYGLEDYTRIKHVMHYHGDR